ncbi:hypothetical protein RRG08_056136 [Elysia crispata]|uniref:Ig-like domain-containing protein n=1 Tax=Elysia crispata TaxID=231223 RepID=A0AAE1D406_9GAST|nr:hypothetical protein RRG08_056136 [Elysia crispata]
MLLSSATCQLLVLTVLFLQGDQVSSQCEPVEEGRPFSITCSGPPCREHLLYEWTAKSASMTERLISHCDTTMDCTGNNDFFTINIAKNGTVGFLSTLTINKVSQTEPFNNEGTWTCQYCGSEKEKCTLKIFVKPVNPKCEATEVTDATGQLIQIKIRCTMEKVYPTIPKCQFQVVDKNGRLVFQNQPKDSCDESVDIGRFQEGQNIIKAKVGSSIQPDFDKIQLTPVSPDIRLRLPKTSIKCLNFKYRDGFYKGETVLCQCILEDQGKPRGISMWLQNGIKLGNSNFSTSHRDRKEELITCVGSSAIGQESPGITFSPEFAFLRSGAINFTTFYEERPDDSCCGNAGILAFCEIATSEVNPSPRIVFLVDNKETSISNSPDTRDENYRHSFRFQPKVGGIFKVMCRVENAIFPELVEERTANITIHSPVQFAESTEVKKYYEFKIQPGIPVIISVEITAYPKATNFTLYRGNPGNIITVDDYGVLYVERSPSTGTVELTMTIDNSSDFTMYSLVMDNGIGEGLTYSFTIEEDTDDDLTVVYIIVGVVIGVIGVIIIVVVVLVVLWRRRHSKTDSDNLEESATNGTGNEEDDKAKSDVEENIYNEPEENEPEKEEEYINCVNNEDALPSEIAPEPPKTTAQGKLDKSKELKEGKKKANFKGKSVRSSDPTPSAAKATSEGKTPRYVNMPSSANLNVQNKRSRADATPSPFHHSMYVNLQDDQATDDPCYASITDQIMY